MKQKIRLIRYLQAIQDHDWKLVSKFEHIYTTGSIYKWVRKQGLIKLMTVYRYELSDKGKHLLQSSKRDQDACWTCNDWKCRGCKS